MVISNFWIGFEKRAMSVTDAAKAAIKGGKSAIQKAVRKEAPDLGQYWKKAPVAASSHELNYAQIAKDHAAKVAPKGKPSAGLDYSSGTPTAIGAAPKPAPAHLPAAPSAPPTALDTMQVDRRRNFLSGGTPHSHFQEALAEKATKG